MDATTISPSDSVYQTRFKLVSDILTRSGYTKEEAKTAFENRLNLEKEIIKFTEKANDEQAASANLTIDQLDSIAGFFPLRELAETRGYGKAGTFNVRDMSEIKAAAKIYTDDYIAFQSIGISGLAVAVISFTLIFGSSMYGMLCSGVNAVGREQTEAARALGYTDLDAFFQIILPQAIRHILPSYKGQVIALLKATAVVGYIAVQDLTKMGDIVRSRTYEAFFPLIAVTVIYFLLAGLIIRVIESLIGNIDPKNRKPEQILKGVERHD